MKIKLKKRQEATSEGMGDLDTYIVHIPPGTILEVEKIIQDDREWDFMLPKDYEPTVYYQFESKTGVFFNIPLEEAEKISA